MGVSSSVEVLGSVSHCTCRFWNCMPKYRKMKEDEKAQAFPAGERKLIGVAEACFIKKPAKAANSLHLLHKICEHGV